jgi:hypothetical protein
MAYKKRSDEFWRSENGCSEYMVCGMAHLDFLGTKIVADKLWRRLKSVNPRKNLRKIQEFLPVTWRFYKD